MAAATALAMMAGTKATTAAATTRACGDGERPWTGSGQNPRVAPEGRVGRGRDAHVRSRQLCHQTLPGGTILGGWVGAGSARAPRPGVRRAGRKHFVS